MHEIIYAKDCGEERPSTHMSCCTEQWATWVKNASMEMIEHLDLYICAPFLLHLLLFKQRKHVLQHPLENIRLRILIDKTVFKHPGNMQHKQTQ